MSNPTFDRWLSQIRGFFRRTTCSHSRLTRTNGGPWQCDYCGEVMPLSVEELTRDIWKQMDQVMKTMREIEEILERRSGR